MSRSRSSRANHWLPKFISYEDEQANYSMELCFISISLYSDVKNTTSFKRYGYWRKTRFFFPVMAKKKKTPLGSRHLKIIQQFWGQFTWLIQYFRFDWAANEDVITEARSKNGQELLIEKKWKKKRP